MKSSTAIIVLVALIVLGLGAYWYSTQSPAPTSQTTTVNNSGGTDYTPPQDTGSTATTSGLGATTTVGVGVGVTTPKTVTVTYTSSGGFSPKTVTIKKGDTVTFVAQNGAMMWVGADEHPTHTQYDGTSRAEHCATIPSTSFDQCKASSAYSFTFTKIGTFNYHNHTSASHTGSVIVQ